MTKKEKKAELAFLKKGLKEFPKVLAQQERAFKHKQKILKAFEPMSKALLKMQKELENKKKQS